MFESWAASEVRKARTHAGLAPDLFHLRQTRGPEADLVVARGTQPAILADAKSGATIASDWLPALTTLSSQLGTSSQGQTTPQLRVIYGGDRRQARSDGEIIPWREIQQTSWK